MISTVQDISFLFDYSAKWLCAFQDELSRDVATQEEMNQRTKLRIICETRWSSRADALATFKNAFPVVVHALETLQEDGNEKAGQYLVAILQFEFIISLIVAEHILSSTVPFAIHPTMPRRAGRQQNKANPDVQTVSDFYRVTLYYVFLDQLVQEMETRILGNESRYCAQY